MRRATLLVTLTAAAAFGGFAATAVNGLLDNRAQANPAPAVPVPAATPALAAPAALPGPVGGQALPSLAPMLRQVMPAVVSVHTKQRVAVSNPFFNDPFFRRMFPQVPQERINESLGSGVIIDAQRGYVLTNHHVIEGADDVSVTLADGRTLTAEFLGSDADTDVALIRIPTGDLSELPLGDSGRLQVGDYVVAIGNPFGLSQTVTSGIVSAVGRSGIRGLGYQNFIQTDASINPGNSGGALVDLRGQLVGINTASLNPRGSMAGNIGLGLAIPSNLARDVVQQLVTVGEVRRGTLGIDSQPLNPRLLRSLGLAENQHGALVTRVDEGSGAAAAGIRPGDVVVEADGQRIADPQALHNLEGLQPVGTPVTLALLREGKRVTAKATLREQPRNADGGALDPRLAGARVAELPEAQRQAFGRGVLVEQVQQDSRAWQSGLRKGDVIIASSAGDFGDLAGFRSSLAQPPQQLVLRVVRGNVPGTMVMR